MLPATTGIGNLIRTVTLKKIKNDFLVILPHLLLDRTAPSMVKAAFRKTQGAKQKARGYSSAGRALEWHSRGQRFDPA